MKCYAIKKKGEKMYMGCDKYVSFNDLHPAYLYNAHRIAGLMAGYYKSNNYEIVEVNIPEPEES